MGFFKNGSKKSGESGEPTLTDAAPNAPSPVDTSAGEAPAAGSGRPPTSPAAASTSSPTAAAAGSTSSPTAAAASAPPTNYDTDGGNRTDGAETDEEGVDDLEGKELDEDLEWDEGGPSQCGYSEPIHGVLMSAGAAIHRVVGDPGEGVKVGMRRIGNFFQEASYAVRDVVRGDAGVKDDARDAWKEMVGAHEGEGPADEDEDGKENDGAAAGGSSSPAASPTATAAN